ncbi:hypothetical protein PIROE2DRAFT_18180 [Piromyces sp. E2]|nr:hypothetical protein PIROE2DRAFT_18180 [Piromyces sp. E2]|eukprot:OUM56982.1 hypothetical protein PIROE2DRAFT_18180 [Piromyces sp. E2]
MVACGPNRTPKTGDPLNCHHKLIIILESSRSDLSGKTEQEKCPTKLNAFLGKVRWYDYTYLKVILTLNP